MLATPGKPHGYISKRKLNEVKQQMGYVDPPKQSSTDDNIDQGPYQEDDYTSYDEFEGYDDSNEEENEPPTKKRKISYEGDYEGEYTEDNKPNNDTNTFNDTKPIQSLEGANTNPLQPTQGANVLTYVAEDYINTDTNDHPTQDQPLYPNLQNFTTTTTTTLPPSSSPSSSSSFTSNSNPEQDFKSMFSMYGDYDDT
eukprot:TRINITY_DN2722_c0_g1_i2.p1 TRINITY_DN2722_c0_g1~~TRINITY_DN2722_c0_g1_i2.p1  ORF type:complete len:197 (-),score=73.99 TRINITY_DN2722_c0_g1_i2:1227-1817(-)